MKYTLNDSSTERSGIRNDAEDTPPASANSKRSKSTSPAFSLNKLILWIGFNTVLIRCQHLPRNNRVSEKRAERRNTGGEISKEELEEIQDKLE